MLDSPMKISSQCLIAVKKENQMLEMFWIHIENKTEKMIVLQQESIIQPLFVLNISIFQKNAGKIRCFRGKQKE